VPRKRRIVHPGDAHYIRQRTTSGSLAFESDEDYLLYLEWLHEAVQDNPIQVLGYTLLPTGAFLIVVPEAEDTLRRVFSSVHTRFALYRRKQIGSSGKFWRERFFSKPLAKGLVLDMVREVELLPVDTGIVQQAEQYRWSSARSRCSFRRDPLLNLEGRWKPLFDSIVDWSSWLSGKYSLGIKLEVESTPDKRQPGTAKLSPAELSQEARDPGGEVK